MLEVWQRLAALGGGGNLAPRIWRFSIWCEYHNISPRISGAYPLFVGCTKIVDSDQGSLSWKKVHPNNSCSFGSSFHCAVLAAQHPLREVAVQGAGRETLPTFGETQGITWCCRCQVRDRWHEDLVGDRLQLKISHNPLVRSRPQCNTSEGLNRVLMTK